MQSCQEMRPLILEQCKSDALSYRNNRDCYEKGSGVKESQGVTVYPNVWKNNPVCTLRKQKALTGAGCNKVGFFEMAFNNNYSLAEVIFRRNCTSKSNNSGCSGLVCLAKNKYHRGEKASAKKMFKTACDNTSTNPGTYDGCSELQSKYISNCDAARKL